MNERPDFKTLGEAEDHGWQTEWEITEGYRFQNGLEASAQFIALGSSQAHAALSARIHFLHKLQNRQIGQG